MQIFLTENLVLFAVPKAGSTALEAASRSRASIILRDNNADRHIGVRGYTRRWAPFLKRSFGFEGEGVAVIRDPVERLGSWYRYRTRLDPSRNRRSTREMSFEEFLAALLDGGAAATETTGSQFTFLTDTAGRIGVTHLFAYDAFDQAIAFLADRFKSPLNAERMNVSPDLELDASLELIGRLRAARADEFALYDRVAENGYLYTPKVGPLP
jgi:hypothetical protein